jgi:lysophospholipase L1-like esterase
LTGRGRTHRSAAFSLSTLWRVALALASLVLVLLAAEGLARLLLPPQQLVEVEASNIRQGRNGPTEEREQREGIDVLLDWSGEHGVRLTPNVRATIRSHRVSGRDVVIETNSLGLRHPQLAPKGADEYRVLVLGDSITLGDYLFLDETYPAQLARRLAGRSQRVVVINAGLPGASTSDELYHYLEISDAVDPDLVLLAMYLNDAQSSHHFYARSLAAPYASSRFLSWAVNRVELARHELWRDETVAEIDPGWREHFRGGRQLQSGDMYHARDAFDFEIYNAHRDFGLAWYTPSWDLLERITRTLSLAARERGHTLAAYLFPVHIQVKGTVDDDRPQASFKSMCRSLDLPCIDLLPILRTNWHDTGRDPYFDHCHLRTHANAVVADALAEWLDREGLVPE